MVVSEQARVKGTSRVGLRMLALALLTGATMLLTAAAASAVQPGATAEQAVAQSVAKYDAVYAGACAGTRSPDDIGKVCSKLVAEQGDLRAYLAGRTFSEYSLWIFVRRSDGGWLPAGIVAFDNSTSPASIPWPASG